jgi:hypothetical protein
MDVDLGPTEKKKAKPAPKAKDDLSEYNLDDYDEEETDAGAYTNLTGSNPGPLTASFNRWIVQQHQGFDLLQR